MWGARHDLLGSNHHLSAARSETDSSPLKLATATVRAQAEHTACLLACSKMRHGGVMGVADTGHPDSENRKAASRQ